MEAAKRAEDAKAAAGASDSSLPPWLVSLPPEVRRRIVDEVDLEKVPPAYRDLVRRYQRWLVENATKDAR